MSDAGGTGGTPPPVTPEDPLIGQTVGSYKIVRELGRGGMGAVYVAEHTLLGKQAAVKVLLPRFSRERDMVNRFFGEAKAAATIKHEGIAEVFDFGYLPDGSGFIVMEFLEGESLTARLEREGCLPLPLIVGIAKQVCAAVGAAHAQQIVHRDLKPDNVYLVPDEAMPNKLRVKVLDFGIAKLADEGQADEVKTQAGEMLGTPWYMSPEQCKGAGEVDARADVYSLGCIIYEMATGTVPFDEKGTGALIAAHIYEPPPPPRTIDANLAPALEALILKALAKEPGERQQTMAVLADELAACLLATENAASGEKGAQAKDAPGGPVPRPAPQPAGPAPTPAPVRVAPAPRSKAPMIYAAVGLGLVAVVGGIWLAGRGKQDKTAAAIPAPADAAPPPVVDAAPPPPPDAAPPKDLAEAFERARQACDDGDRAACVRAGLAWERGQGPERDASRAFAAYLDACDHKLMDACARLAAMYRDGRGVALDLGKAAALAIRACDADVGLGCAELGMMAWLGQGQPFDLEKSLGHFTRACELGDATACALAAAAWQDGRGVDADASKAAPLWTRAAELGGKGCDENDGRDCLALAWARAEADDAAGASSAVDRACVLGLARACAEAAAAAGGAAGASEQARLACEAGDDLGCALHGRALVAAGETDAALDALERACNAGGEQGCRDLAALYAQGGAGVERDDGRATALYRKGCDGGDAAACATLAPRLETGVGARKDARKARAAAERACAVDGALCAAAGRFAATGVGGAADLELAKRHYARACARGVSEACPLAQDPLPAPDAGVTVEAPAPDGGE